MNPSSDTPDGAVAALATRGSGAWLHAGRAVWGVLALLGLGLALAGIPAHYDRLLESAANNQRALQDLGMSHGSYAAYLSSLGIATVLVHVLIAAVLMWRRADEWMAQFVSFALLTNGVINPLSTVHDLADANGAVRPLVELMVYGGMLSAITLLYVFPNGRFVPRWTLPLAALWAVVAFPAVFFPESPVSMLEWPLAVLILVLLGSAATGTFSQAYRYVSVSSSLQRQQAKWAVVGLVLAVIGPLAYFLPFGVSPSIDSESVPNIAYNRLGSSLFTFSLVFRLGVSTLLTFGMMLFPISFVIAVLRYRLWDIGVVLNRALVYVAVTGSLALVYFLSIVVLQALFRSVTGQERSLVIVISTLTIAALFVPLRRRAQGVIDRRFFRRKYDAAQTLTAFSATMRDEVDLERLSGELVSVVEETMQPAHASLWMLEKRSGDAPAR